MEDTTSSRVPPASPVDLAEERRKRRPGPRLEAPPEYRTAGGCLRRVKHARDGAETLEPLANFTARIVEEVSLDDGAGPPTLSFRVEGATAEGEALPSVEVPAADFGGMEWVAKHWGQRATVYPGQGKRDHLRAAIQSLSNPARRTVYTHTGWSKVNGAWVYLHGGGAVGAQGLETRLDGGLRHFCLPEGPGSAEEVRAAVGAVLGLLDVAPARIVWPLLGAAFLAPLCEPLRAAGCEPAFLLWMHGASGTRKTSLAALVQALYGDFEPERLPATFHNTANALERQAFQAKDALLVVDDFRRELPERRARERMEQTADALVRSQGNRAGRERMKADTTMRAAYAPRGLVLATGEDLPAGESTVGRIFALEVGRDDVKLDDLTEAQAGRERLPVAMRAYLEWMRTNLGAIGPDLRREWEARREEAQQKGHARLPAAAAHLCVGATILLRFAAEVGALKESLEDAEAEAHATILAAAAAQAGHALEQDPALRFVRCLSDLMETGQARVAGGPEPPGGAAAGAPYLGELEGDVLYLVPDTAREAVNGALGRRGEAPMPYAKTLGRRLEEGGYLAQTSEARGQGRATVRPYVAGKQVRRMALRWPPADGG